jgi:hypothetical protein
MSHTLALTVPQTIRRMAPKLALGPPNGFDEQMFGGM